MRVPQPVGKRGSLKWVQRLVAHHEKPLHPVLRASGCISATDELRWCSPLASDDWAEYRDGDFLDVLGIPHLRAALREFWPRGGPQWDALATTSSGSVLLFEAKAHTAELVSKCAASPPSRARIAAALARTKLYYGVEDTADWMAPYYQYANRIAHLYFLRSHGVKVSLVFLYFCGDREMNGPASPEQWATALRTVHRTLGLPDRGIPGAESVFIDVSELFASAP